MIFRSIALRLIIILLLTWIIAAFTGSFGWSIYFAVVPFVFYEMVRGR